MTLGIMCVGCGKTWMALITQCFHPRNSASAREGDLQGIADLEMGGVADNAPGAILNQAVAAFKYALRRKDLEAG